MKMKILLYLAVFFICGAAIGIWIGQRTIPEGSVATGCRPITHGELDLFYTEVLNVSTEQKARIMEIEQDYQAKRDQFTEQMHQANLNLADVIEKEGYESGKIRPLVTEIHRAMGELQTLSLIHLAAIEAVLNPKQAALLKNNAVGALRQN